MVKRYYDAGKEVIKFLNSLRNLVKSKGIRTPEQAYEFAKNQFGKIPALLKKQIDDIFKKKDVAKTEKKGDVVPIKKDEGIKSTQEYKDIVEELRKSEIGNKYAGDDLEKAALDILNIRNKNKIRLEGEINPKTNQMPDQQREFLGFPNRSVEAIVRTAARAVLEKAGLGPRIKGQDPIDMARQIYGDEILDALDNISGELLDASSYPEISRILTEKKIYNFKPRQGLDVRQKGEIEDITAFDPEGRDPNADGGIIGSLRLNRTGFDKGTKKPSGRGAPWKKSPFSISDDWIEKWLDKLRKKKKKESESGLNNILKL